MTDVDFSIRRDGGDREDIPLRYGPVRVDPDGTVTRLQAPPSFPLDAEQIVRDAGFLITLVRQVLAKPGDAIPSAERLTLNLGKAMGVTLPVHEEATAFGPGGTRIQSDLLPYGATSIPAVLDREGR